MTTTDLLRWALTMTGQSTERIVADLRSSPLTPSTPGAKGGDGHHALWILGHLCVVEGSVPAVLFGLPNPAEHLKPLFAAGTTPRPDGHGYPTFDALLATFRRLRAENLELLDELGENGLARAPDAPPPGFEEVMATAAHTLLLTALHTMVHYGQIADARRVAGLPPLF